MTRSVYFFVLISSMVLPAISTERGVSVDPTCWNCDRELFGAPLDSLRSKLSSLYRTSLRTNPSQKGHIAVFIRKDSNRQLHTVIDSVDSGIAGFSKQAIQFISDYGFEYAFDSMAVLINCDTVPTPFGLLVDSPLANFDSLCHQFDLRYSFFELKKLDWDSLCNAYRRKVTKDITNDSLSRVLQALLHELKDVHVSLTSSLGDYSYKPDYGRYCNGFPGDSVISRYFKSGLKKMANGYIGFGILRGDIGYIGLTQGLNGDSIEWARGIDDIVDSLSNTRGIVIDLRDNGGGSSELGEVIARRFADTRRVFMYLRWRNGPRHSDFTAIDSGFIYPEGRSSYRNQVVLLSNRYCASSTEMTILMFSVLPKVTTIGDTTCGCSANPEAFQLPNGFSFTISRWIDYDITMRPIEGNGIVPGITVKGLPADSQKKRDTVLEYAIRFLSKSAKRRN